MIGQPHKSLICKIISGRVIENVDKYKDCKIEFGISTETRYDIKKNGPFDVMNYMKFSTKISISTANIKEIIFNILIFLKRGDKVIESSELKFRNCIQFICKQVYIGSLSLLIIFSINGQSISNNLYTLEIHKDFSQIRRFNIPSNLNLKYAARNCCVYEFTEDNKHYAIKAIGINNTEEYKSFVRELSLYLLIGHPCIITMVGYCQINQQFGFVLEFAENGSLKECEADISFSKCMEAICSSMSLLHSFGIIHRDLKPGNILVDSNFDIKLADFGISRSYDEYMTKDVGTPGFIAPEVSKGSYDYSADVYSAGVVACFLIDRKNYSKCLRSIKDGKHVKSVPYETQVIIRAMLSEDPEDRPTFNEIYYLIRTNSFFIINDYNEEFKEFLNSNYETGNDYIHYMKSKNNIGLFHCLMFHFINNNKDKAGELSHLGKLIGDEFMSYLFNWLVIYTDSIAQDIEIFYKENIIERFFSMNIDDYRFWLMPPPAKIYHPKIKFNYGEEDDYSNGIKLKNTDQENALHYFKKSFKSGNIEAGYQIGRIYSLMNDSRCIKYLNHLSLSGHKKSCYYLAKFFGRSKYKRHSKLMNYFFRISDLYFVHSFTKKHDIHLKTVAKIDKFENVSKLFFDNHTNTLYNTNWMIYLKLHRILGNFQLLIVSIYFYVFNDIELTRFYLRKSEELVTLVWRFLIGDEKEKEKIFEILERKEREGEDVAKFFLITLEYLDNKQGGKSRYFKELMNGELCTIRAVQCQRALDFFLHLDYLNGKMYLDFADNQNFVQATFLRCMFTYHGHFYEKEREESLEKLISIGEKHGADIAYEVGIMLLQGIYTMQNIDKGKELIKIAELCGFVVPKEIKEDRYHISIITVYFSIINQEYDTYFENKKHDMEEIIKSQEPICINPKFQTIAGIICLNKNDYENAKKWLRMAIEQDYFEAEFYYALVCNEEESIDHLLKASKGGVVGAQILLGLAYIYGIKHEVDVDKGIYWLEYATFQEEPVSFMILGLFYYFGQPIIPRDLIKSKTYISKFNILSKNMDIGTIYSIRFDFDDFIVKFDKNLLRLLESNIYEHFIERLEYIYHL